MGRVEEREGEEHQCVLGSHAPSTGDQARVTQACAPAGNQTSDPLVCRPVLNPLSHTSQGKNKRFFKNQVRKKRERISTPNLSCKL